MSKGNYDPCVKVQVSKLQKMMKQSQSLSKALKLLK